MAAPDVHCKYNYFGHCKYESTCHKKHLSETCSNFPCRAQNCKKRHPYLCRYFENFNKCKFGDKCSYLHRENQSYLNLKEIHMLKEQILKLQVEKNNLENIIIKLNNMEEEIKYLREKLEKSETIILDSKVENDNKLNENYHCEFCDFNAKSEGGLKTHQRAKHKEENPMRGAESSIEENVRSLDKESERSISLHPKFKCYLCSELLPTLSDLITHHKCKHKDHPNKLICEDCNETCTHAAMLVSHKQIKHNIYICARCNTQFYGREKIDDHNKKKHSDL